MPEYDDYVKDVIESLDVYGELHPLMPEMIKVLWDNGLTIVDKSRGCKFYGSKTGVCLRMFLKCIDDDGNDVDCEVAWIRSNHWDPRDITKTHILDALEIVE